jgi:AAHS family 4-hydroxybenzoate transporter-like MFS transporter
MLGGLLAAQILPGFGWRGLYAVGGVLPLVFGAILWAAMPESPRFMAQREKLWPELARFFAKSGRTVAHGSVFEDSAEIREVGSISVKSLFKNGLARDTCGLWLAFFSCLGSIYIIFGWLPEMLRSVGFDVSSASSGLALYNLGGVAGVLVWAALIPLLGSRRSMLWGALACAVSAALVLVIRGGSASNHGLLLDCITVNGLLANAIQCSLYALAAHVYPTGVRATGIAYSATIGRIGGLISSPAGGALIPGGGKAYWTVLAVAMVVACAGIGWVRNHIPRARVSS